MLRTVGMGSLRCENAVSLAGFAEESTGGGWFPEWEFGDECFFAAAFCQDFDFLPRSGEGFFHVAHGDRNVAEHRGHATAGHDADLGGALHRVEDVGAGHRELAAIDGRLDLESDEET